MMLIEINNYLYALFKQNLQYIVNIKDEVIINYNYYLLE